MQDLLDDTVRGRVERLQHSLSVVEAEDHGALDVEQLAAALGGDAGQLVGIEDAAGGDRQRMKGLEDPGLFLPLDAQRGGLDRRRHLGRQQEQDVTQLGPEIASLPGTDQQTAEELVANP